ncbi:hypothetical protein [Rhodoflexus sp.]
MIASLTDLDLNKRYSYADYPIRQFVLHNAYGKADVATPFLFPELTIPLQDVFE